VRSGQPAPAAALVLQAAPAGDAQAAAAWGPVLEEFTPAGLEPAQWCDLQLLRAAWQRAQGNLAHAITICRQALRAAPDAARQARCFHQLGKLHEDHNPARALGFYQQALERHAPTAAERVDVLKDRAWLFIICEDWANAQADLDQALAHTPPPTDRQRADLYDALATLYSRRRAYPQAVAYGQQALALREALGDLPRIADMCNNLGNIYAEMGQLVQARAAYEEALAIYRQLGSQVLLANVQLNIGAALYDAGHSQEALPWYTASLEIYQATNLPRGQARACYNLAEAHLALGQPALAAHYWHIGYAASQQAGLADELQSLQELAQAHPALQPLPGSSAPAGAPLPALAPAESKAMELVRRYGFVTPKLLMEHEFIAKPTATRLLSDLVRRGLLHKQGRGRGTRYVLPEPK
jgi:tetratricopeptide (TPR) repeat protein